MERTQSVLMPKTNDVRKEVMALLVSNMSISKASIFIRENLSQDTDYLEIKDKLFANKDAEDIYSEIKKRGK